MTRESCPCGLHPHRNGDANSSMTPPRSGPMSVTECSSPHTCIHHINRERAYAEGSTAPHYDHANRLGSSARPPYTLSVGQHSSAIETTGLSMCRWAGLDTTVEPDTGYMLRLTPHGPLQPRCSTGGRRVCTIVVSSSLLQLLRSMSHHGSPP
jgi:hypothetical protein